MLTLMFKAEALQHPALRWLYAAGWTALITLLLLQSSSQPIIGPPAPPGKPTLEREILLTIGHGVIFATLLILWWWALIPRCGFSVALAAAVALSLALGTFTEAAQASVPDRMASWSDLIANWLAVLFAAWHIYRSRARQSLHRSP